MDRSIILLSSLFVFGCAGTIKDPITVYKVAPMVCSVVKPSPVAPLDVNIQVIQDKENVWWVALDDLAYKNIALNNKDVNRYIKDLQLYADTLNDCIKDTQDGNPN